MRKILSFTGLLLAMTFWWGQATAQKSQYQQSPSERMDEAMTLFRCGRYSAAADAFHQIYSATSDSSFVEQALYFEALSAKWLKRPNAPYLLGKVISVYPAGIYAQPALFHVGEWYFQKNEFKNCWNQLQLIDALLLPDSLLGAFYFEGGYAQMKTRKPTGARQWFEQSVQREGMYKIPSHYYLGQLYTQANQNQKALEQLKYCYGDAHFGASAMELSAQCQYQSGKYDEVVKLMNAHPEYSQQVSLVRLAGWSAYLTNQYGLAANWLGNLANQGKLTNDSDYYALGVSQLKSGAPDQAIFALEKLSNEKSPLGQNAAYNLAWAFLQTEKKDNARSAFYLAAQAGYDKQIQEESAFEYAKLTYELLPNNAVALVALQQFIDQYGQSVHVDEASDMLGGLLLNTHRYKEALKIMEGMKMKTNAIKTVIQKSAYCLGEQCYMNNQNKEAEAYFKKSLEYPLDPKFKVLAGFWLGEVDYREGRFDQAIHYFDDFLKTPEARNNIHYSDCLYNLGYCYFRQKKYKDAISWYEQFLAGESFFGKKPEMVTDARLRLADAYFCEKNYPKALDAYSTLIEKNVPSTDYALFQKGIIHGLLNMPHDKLATLEKLVQSFPSSIYTDEALFEMGYTAFEIGKLDDALDYFDELINKYPNSRNLRRAHLNIGLLFYNQDQNQKAIEQLKYVVAQFPKTDESEEALDALEEIYVAQGNVQEFLAFTKSIGKTNIKASVQDSLLYQSAYNSYLQNQAENAIQNFSDYIATFPDGYFIAKAHFFRGELYFAKKEYDQALVDYQQSLTYSPELYPERCHKNVAFIFYQKKQYAQALPEYVSLEKYAETKENKLYAHLGQMRCSWITSDKELCLKASDMVLNTDVAGNEQKLEAHYYLMKLCYANGENENTQKHIKAVLAGPRNRFAAEAKYLQTELMFTSGERKNIKKQVNALSDQFGEDFPFWEAKAYLLLAKNYALMGDTLQAKFTLQTILDNFEVAPDDPESIPDLVKAEMEKLSPKKEPEVQPEIAPNQEEEKE